MGYSDLVRKNISLADKLTRDLQDYVDFYPWLRNDDFGGPIYSPTPIKIKAIVEEKEYQRRLNNGQEITQKAKLTILRPIAATGGEGRREPIDPRDKIVLPSGYSGPILNVDGLTDPETHNPFMLEVTLG